MTYFNIDLCNTLLYQNISPPFAMLRTILTNWAIWCPCWTNTVSRIVAAVRLPSCSRWRMSRWGSSMLWSASQRSRKGVRRLIVRFPKNWSLSIRLTLLPLSIWRKNFSLTATVRTRSFPCCWWTGLRARRWRCMLPLTIRTTTLWQCSVTVSARWRLGFARSRLLMATSSPTTSWYAPTVHWRSSITMACLCRQWKVRSRLLSAPRTSRTHFAPSTISTKPSTTSPWLPLLSR